jgi:ABC-type amino acid transport substrate-binding protein
MGRLRSLAALLAALAGTAPAAAAEITRVASSGEPEKPFALSLEVRWERIARRANVTREFGENQGQPATGVIRDAPELKYTQVTNRIVPRLAVGLWRDVELRAELPYVLSDDTTWKSAADSAAVSGVLSNGVDANGLPCATAPCPIVPVGVTHYAGGALGDLRLGLAWAIHVERKDPWAPTWVVSLDVTAPTAPRYDPAAGRLTAATWSAPASFTSAGRSPVGRKIWVYDLATALSRRMGAAEPYVKAHLAIPQRSGSTYSNCEHAAALAAQDPAQMSSVAAANCALPAWKNDALARPPLVLGMLLGTELVVWEEKASGQHLTFDLRGSVDFVGRARWYNELTPATGKLLATDPYLALGALVAVDLRASRHISLRAQGTFQHDLAHFVSGEAQGNVMNEIGVAGGDVNPNFDWRYDLPGRRFRIGDVIAWTVTVSGAVHF